MDSRGLQQENTQQSTSSARNSDKKMLDLTRDKPIKISVKIMVPVKDHPKFNFVGKLLGPKGNTLKRLQEETLCKMAVLGKGSMRDRDKEEDLRKSGDAKYVHLREDLHVEVSAHAPAAEAHARVAYALALLARYLVPDYNDDIRQEQMLEMQLLQASGVMNANEAGGSGDLSSHGGDAGQGVNVVLKGTQTPDILNPVLMQPQTLLPSPELKSHGTWMSANRRRLRPSHSVAPSKRSVFQLLTKTRAVRNKYPLYQPMFGENTNLTNALNLNII